MSETSNHPHVGEHVSNSIIKSRFGLVAINGVVQLSEAMLDRLLEAARAQGAAQ